MSDLIDLILYQDGRRANYDNDNQMEINNQLMKIYLLKVYAPNSYLFRFEVHIIIL
jgi:hypothetical protein